MTTTMEYLGRREKIAENKQELIMFTLVTHLIAHRKRSERSIIRFPLSFYPVRPTMIKKKLWSEISYFIIHRVRETSFISALSDEER